MSALVVKFVLRTEAAPDFCGRCGAEHDVAPGILVADRDSGSPLCVPCLARVRVELHGAAVAALARALTKADQEFAAVMLGSEPEFDALIADLEEALSE